MSLSHKDDEDDFFSADEGSHGEESEVEDQAPDLITNYSVDVKCGKNAETPFDDAIHEKSESTLLVAEKLDSKVEQIIIPDSLSESDDQEDWVQFPEPSKTDIPSSMNEDKDQESPTEASIENDHDQKKSWFGDWNSILSNAGRIGTSVLESVESTLGAPSPEELAEITWKNEQKTKSEAKEQETSDYTCQDDKQTDLGGLLHNVTHLFENTGRTLLAGSLDVMENIGKTSFNVLTEPSTSSKNNSRRKFRFQPSDKPNLSEVLREARQKTEVEQAGWGWDDEKVDLENENANSKLKIPKFDDYFERYNGNVHLDALKMFSESQEMQITSILESLTNEKRRILNFKLQKLMAKFDEILSDDHSTSDEEYKDFITNFNELWAKLGVKVYKCDRLIDIYKKHNEILSGLDVGEDPVIIMQKNMDFFGEFASAIVETFLKVGQLLTVEKRPPEIICLAKITKLLVHEVNEKAVSYSSLLEMCSKKIENEPGISYLTDMFVEAMNCSICVKESSKLLIPIMKILYFESSFPCTD